MAVSLAIVGARRYHGVMPMDFAERLARAQQSSGSLVCVGLDPDPAKLPADLGALDPSSGAAPLFAFNRRIIDATAGLAAAYKPQVAFYSAQGAEEQLVSSIRYIRERAPTALVILDAKRNDIGNTAEAYVREAFDRYGADAVTVNPYMGEDSVRPFLARPDRGAILLCRTSNPGAADFQDLLVDGLPLYRRVAERAAAHWNEHGNLMLVVGATCPREMTELRRAHPELSFLVPGIGAQGGDLEATLAAGLDARGAGLLISSSRNIIYAGGGAAGSIRAAAAELCAAINRQRPRELERALDRTAVDPQCRAIGRRG
jgi:orotidine-5'-phosphate decarboxylase